MDYQALLERTRLPQPSLQKLAVISIFQNLRSSSLSGPDFDRAVNAVAQCLNSNSPAVIDQSVREVCLLVKDSKLDVSRGLLELQSALEGTHSRFVNVFVKAIGFIVQLGFRNDVQGFRFPSAEAHPFVKVLSCRKEVHSELVRQVLAFIMQNRHLGMDGVCEFLRPFLNFLVLQMSSSAIVSFLAKNLLSSIASLCCSFPEDALPVFKLLMRCFKHMHRDSAENVARVSHLMETTVDAFVAVLSHLAGDDMLIHEAQLCGAELLELVFSLCRDIHKFSGGEECIFDMSRRLIVVQSELGLEFIPEVSTVILSLFVSLIQSDIEHIQLSILKLVLALIQWKSVNETIIDVHEEILFVFPTINLMSSPSRYVKEAASELLVILRKLSVGLLVSPINELLVEERFPRISRLEDIISRVFRHLWSQDQTSFYLHWIYDKIVEEQNFQRSWTASIMEYCQKMVEAQKSSLSKSQSQEISLCEIPPLIVAIASVLIVHPTLGNSAADLLAVTVSMDPKLGVPLFLVIIFYQNIFCGKGEEMNFHDILLKLLKVLPNLVSHSAMIPLVVQIILPMLQKDANPVLYAMALRLLCKTWEINDRIFASLQGLLLPEAFTQFKCERSICISMAVTIRDVCQKNPDRGVDIILSVEACIESTDVIIQAFGVQSLSLLCEADVIDFYTAWSVIAKYALRYSNDPVVVNSICLLLKWGAMDVESYPENATSILQILWKVATSKYPFRASSWANARASAFEALIQYEVPHILQFIPDFREKNIEVLVSETDPKVLEALEIFEAKMITHEHITRRRVLKEKRMPANKIEKLLDVFPRAIGLSGINSKERKVPGAALFHLSFSAEDENNKGGSKVLHDLHAKYEMALVEIAASLQLSRNMIVALLSLQSWKPFLQHWLHACIKLLDIKAPTSVLDTTSKAADDILKCMKQRAEKSIPRSAENIGLAVGALCLVLPPSDHATKVSASKFLLSWLFQHEHEYRQWSAAISLGVISSCLHVTDHKQKFQNINALLEVACTSKSTLVRGACGLALGYSCQDLLTHFQAGANSHRDKELHEFQESDLLGKIIRTICRLIDQHTLSSTTTLEALSEYFPQLPNTTDPDITSSFLNKSSDNIEEDIWGVAGLVIGLGSSVTAVYRSGYTDAVKKIQNLIISWIPHENPLEPILSLGACLAIPIVVSFTQKVELIDNVKLNYLVGGYKELISELLSTKSSVPFRQNLLMASCVGAGSYLGCILNEGVHSLDAKCVKELLDMFKEIYSYPQPPLVHLGAMLGVINALGAGAGTMFLRCPLPFSRSGPEQKESSYICGPLFSNADMELRLTSLIQDIFLVAQHSDDHQLQHFAAWAVSFLRHYIWSSDLHKVDGAKPNSASQSFPNDNVVMKLSIWLMNLNYSGAVTSPHISTVATVLRCLTNAPRLPQLDWGPIIRRCMRYEDADILQGDPAFKRGKLREACLVFSLVHGSNFNALLTFLDELFDLSRFKMLQMNLQLCILSHMPHTLKIFSGSRLEKLFSDLTTFIQSPSSSDHIYNPEQKSLLRISCWKGVHLCFEEASLVSEDLLPSLENFMEVLFSLLPKGSRLRSLELSYEGEEWSKAVRCLGKARHVWLSHCLQIEEMSFSQESHLNSETKKKMIAKARLVEIGSIPLNELSQLKPYILNTRSDAIWEVLVEVVMALQHVEGSIKRPWLVDAAEISCVTSYPTTAIQFIGLLCGSMSKYMPLLTVNPRTVLSDLPVTLTSLLLDNSPWGIVAESVASIMWTSTKRIYSWVSNEADFSTQQSIDEPDRERGVFLLKVMHQTCVALQDHLSPEQQLMLANMTIP
uniref:protein RST1 n=1 Tax=Erigeron canadensis TaxID=72917 RepID=UPI001CB97DB3|nr:protein RST1 [Erigeron canadensis]